MQVPSRMLRAEHMLELGDAQKRPKDPVAPTAYGGFLPPPRPKKHEELEAPGRKKTALMWSKQVLEGIRDDSVEMVKIGLSYSIAEPESKVKGGLYGSPFIFGLEGFNIADQINIATSALKTLARDNADHNRHFVHPEEWEANDRDYERIGRYCAAPLLKSAVRGDSALHLALRALSYKVASYLANDIIDPWEPNEEGERPSKLIDREVDAIRLDLISIREIKRKEDQARQGKLYFPTAEEEALVKEEKPKLVRLAHIPCICEGMQERIQKRITNAEELMSKIRRFKIMALPIPKSDLEEANKWKEYTEELEFCQEIKFRATQLIDRHPGAIPAVSLQGDLAAVVFDPFATISKNKSTLHIKTAKKRTENKRRQRRRGGGGHLDERSVANLLTNFMDEFEVAAHKIQVAWRRRHQQPLNESLEPHER
mmetsp:Transcript_38428/g.49564  ORF Transcript_38428/g.49564 Transcript_38428/m.49564 type:complete len:427 (+) Transcript_38428:125-1405(+)